VINDEQLKKWIKTGATLTRDLQEATLKNGFMCSLYGFEKTHQPTDINEIKADIITYKHLLKAGQYVGLWQDNGLIYVDISRHYNNKQDAIKNGIKNKQLAIYDLKNKKDIKLLQKTWILYKYNKINHDLRYIKEYYTIKDMTEDLQKSYRVLKNYIIKDIDNGIKELLQDKYIIGLSSEYMRYINEINEG